MSSHVSSLQLSFVLEQYSYNEGTIEGYKDHQIKPKHLSGAGPCSHLLLLTRPPLPLPPLCSVEGLSIKMSWLLLLATTSIGSGKKETRSQRGSMCPGPLLVPCGCAPVFLDLYLFCLGRNRSGLLFLLQGQRSGSHHRLKNLWGQGSNQKLVLGGEGV